METVATGFKFIEGPVWFLKGHYLLFSDIPANRIYKLTAEGQVTTFRYPSGNSNGLTHDPSGHLIACEQGNRRVTRTETDGSISVLAEKFQGRRLNSPNDVVVKSDGAVYFTDPPYGITIDRQEQEIQGVYRLSPDGKGLAVVADDFVMPNGLAFSPDEKRLYINDSSKRRHIRVFNVMADGTLDNGTIFHEMKVREPGVPDGMKVDLDGRVYCTGPGGIWVFDKSGVHLGTIRTPEQPCNCAWGEEDLKSLYITANTSVYRIRVCCPGIELPCQ
jgi:gluconolactonase